MAFLALYGRLWQRWQLKYRFENFYLYLCNRRVDTFLSTFQKLDGLTRLTRVTFGHVAHCPTCPAIAILQIAKGLYKKIAANAR